MQAELAFWIFVKEECSLFFAWTHPKRYNRTASFRDGSGCYRNTKRWLFSLTHSNFGHCVACSRSCTFRRRKRFWAFAGGPVQFEIPQRPCRRIQQRWTHESLVLRRQASESTLECSRWWMKSYVDDNVTHFRSSRCGQSPMTPCRLKGSATRT